MVREEFIRHAERHMQDRPAGSFDFVPSRALRLLRRRDSRDNHHGQNESGVLLNHATRSRHGFSRTMACCSAVAKVSTRHCTMRCWQPPCQLDIAPQDAAGASSGDGRSEADVRCRRRRQRQLEATRVLRQREAAGREDGPSAPRDVAVPGPVAKSGALPDGQFCMLAVNLRREAANHNKGSETNLYMPLYCMIMLATVLGGGHQTGSLEQYSGPKQDSVSMGPLLPSFTSLLRLLLPI